MAAPHDLWLVRSGANGTFGFVRWDEELAVDRVRLGGAGSVRSRAALVQWR
jgi:hypothetical protein